MLCRRMFLKSSAFVAATLLSAKTLFADILETDLLEADRLEEAEGGFPVGKLSLYNVNLNERLTVTYRNSFGEYYEDALQALNALFRCHYNNEMTKMDLRVIEYLNRLDNSLGGLPLAVLQRQAQEQIQRGSEEQPAHEGNGHRSRHPEARARPDQACRSFPCRRRRRVLPPARVRPHRLRSLQVVGVTPGSIKGSGWNPVSA